MKCAQIHNMYCTSYCEIRQVYFDYASLRRMVVSRIIRPARYEKGRWCVYFYKVIILQNYSTNLMKMIPIVLKRVIDPSRRDFSLSWPYIHTFH